MVGIAPEDDDGEAASRPVQDAVTFTAPATHFGADVSSDPVLLQAVKPGRAGAAGEIVTQTGESFLFYKKPLKSIAEQACQDGAPVTLEVKRSASGNRYVDSVRRAAITGDSEPEVLRVSNNADDVF